MAEGRTASFDPVTGERRETVFQYEPAQPKPQDFGMSSINPQAVAEWYRTQKIEDADRAVSSAIQFQGLRGYQQALKSGESAEKALAKYGPMMFYSRPQAFGPSVRALTPKPPPTVPQITPYQKESLELQRQRLNRTPTMTPYQQEQVALRKQEIANRRPPASPLEKADISIAQEAYKAAVDELQQLGERKEGGMLGLGGNAKAYDAAVKARDEARAKLEGATPKLSEQAAKTATPMPRNKAELKRGERYLTPRGEATWDGEKFVQ